MDSLKFRPGPPCPTLLRPAGGLSLKRPYDRFRDGPPAERSAYGRLLPFWTPHAVRLCVKASHPHRASMASFRSFRSLDFNLDFSVFSGGTIVGFKLKFRMGFWVHPKKYFTSFSLKIKAVVALALENKR
jgi:hypothetical protein